MTLGDCIREYREERGMSQRRFADVIGISNAYVSILENNYDQKTKSAPVASLGLYMKIAEEMGISAHELMEMADESTVSLGADVTLENYSQSIHPDVIAMLDQNINERQHSSEKRLMDLFFAMTDSDKEKLLDYAQYIVDSYKRPDKRR